MTSFPPPDNSDVGTKRLFDSFGNWFQFAVFPISSRPNYRNAVYGFMTASGYIQYIGRAEHLPNRLSGHDRLDEAIAQGAQYLLVHVPLPNAAFPYKDVEERLIKALSPGMNIQHNSLAGILSGLAPARSDALGLGLINSTPSRVSETAGALGLGLINRTPSHVSETVGALGLAAGFATTPSAVPVGNGFGMNSLAAFLDTLEPKPLGGLNALADLMRALEPDPVPFGFGGIVPRK